MAQPTRLPVPYVLITLTNAENDAALWEEIEKNGDGVVMGIGH
jgi:hypothetical protein